MDWNSDAPAVNPVDGTPVEAESVAPEPEAVEVHEDDLVVLERLEADLAEIDAELTALNSAQNS